MYTAVQSHLYRLTVTAVQSQVYSLFLHTVQTVIGVQNHSSRMTSWKLNLQNFTRKTDGQGTDGGTNRGTTKLSTGGACFAMPKIVIFIKAY